MCIHVAGVSMSSSGNLPSSTPLKESSKLINNNTSILLVKSVTFNLYLLRASMALVLFFDCAYIRHLCQSIRPSGTFVQIYLKYWFGVAYRERFLHLYNAIQLRRVSSLTPLRCCYLQQSLLFKAPFPCLWGWWFCSAPNNHLMTFGMGRGGDRNPFLVGAVCCVLLHQLFLPVAGV